MLLSRLQSLAACRDGPAIQALLPSVRALLRGDEASSDDGGPAETGPSVARALLDELARLLAKVDEMRTQRAALEEQLRKQLADDEISSILLEHKHQDPQVPVLSRVL